RLAALNSFHPHGNSPDCRQHAKTLPAIYARAQHKIQRADMLSYDGGAQIRKLFSQRRRHGGCVLSLRRRPANSGLLILSACSRASLDVRGVTRTIISEARAGKITRL